MNKFFVSILALSFIAAGCGKLQQDPLDGSADPILNGRPPGQKPDPEKPVESNLVMIDGPSSFSLMEERGDKIEFKIRILLPDYEGALEIPDIDRYPGATFDAATGAFAWTPPKGFVADGAYRDLDLSVKGIGTPKTRGPGAMVYTRTENVHLTIYRKLVLPEVKSVSTYSKSFREGTSYTLTVVVQDPDGGANNGEAPSLMILPPNPASNISKSFAPFASIDAVFADVANKKWTFTVRIQLANVEFTTSSDIGGMTLRAVNRFNQTSAETSFSMKVYTLLGDLATSWNDIELTAGTDNSIPFLIYDPRGEAVVEAYTTVLPSGANIKCQSSKTGMLSCTLNWKIPDSLGNTTQTMTVKAKGRNQDWGDTTTVNKNFDLRVTVKPKPAPPPPPPAPPTPPPDPNPAPIPTPSPTPSPSPNPRPRPVSVEGVAR